jgi:hypothetical protein
MLEFAYQILVDADERMPALTSANPILSEAGLLQPEGEKGD